MSGTLAHLPTPARLRAGQVYSAQLRCRGATEAAAPPPFSNSPYPARQLFYSLFDFIQTGQMVSRQAKLQEDTYYRVMRLLQESPDLTQRELAQRLGVSVGGLHYCLRALIAKGWVKMQNFSHSTNKFGYVYTLTLAGIAQRVAFTSSFLKRKMDEYDPLKVEIASLQMGLRGGGPRRRI